VTRNRKKRISNIEVRHKDSYTEKVLWKVVAC
jgi:hypothetical protein